MDVTNKMLIDFFGLDKVLANKCPILEEYLSYRKKQNKPLEKKNNNFLGLACLFMSKPEFNETDDDNRFYHALNGDYKNGNGRFKPETLKGLEMGKIDTFLENIKAKPWLTKEFKEFSIEDLVALEKWHLFVSWYALEEFYAWDDKKVKVNESKWLTQEKYNKERANKAEVGILNFRITCEELLLWMYEAASKVDKEEKKKLDILYEKIKSKTIEGDEIWNELSGGDEKAIRGKIYTLIENYYITHQTDEITKETT